MANIVIVVSPSLGQRGKRRIGRFDARLKATDELICSATRQPLLDASRVLLRRGFDPSTVVCKVRSDAPAVVTMKAPIGVAGQYDVRGEKFVRRKLASPPVQVSEIKREGPTPTQPALNARAGLELLHKRFARSSPTASSSRLTANPRPKGK